MTLEEWSCWSLGDVHPSMKEYMDSMGTPAAVPLPLVLPLGQRELPWEGLQRLRRIAQESRDILDRYNPKMLAQQAEEQQVALLKAELSLYGRRSDE